MNTATDTFPNGSPRSSPTNTAGFSPVRTAPRTPASPRWHGNERGHAEGSGTDTAFRNNLFGDPNAPIPGVDIRKEQNQQVKGIVTNADNAIAYMALAFVDDSVPSIGLAVEGTEYVPGEDLAEGGYPLAHDLHCYTWDGTSEREAAFLRMILHGYG